MTRSHSLIMSVLLALCIFAGLASPILAQSSTPLDSPSPFVQFLNILLAAVVTATTPVLVGYVVQLLRQLLAKAKASMSAEQWLLLQSLGATVVAAAEQSGLSKQITDEGDSKKAWAINELQRIAAERGLKGLDLATLSSIIESEVYRQFNEQPKPVPLVSIPNMAVKS